VTITITIEQEVNGIHLIADHRLTDTEIDLAAFDIVNYYVSILREKIKKETESYENHIRNLTP
jgi:hypothetical protein